VGFSWALGVCRRRDFLCLPRRDLRSFPAPAGEVPRRGGGGLVLRVFLSLHPTLPIVTIRREQITHLHPQRRNDPLARAPRVTMHEHPPVVASFDAERRLAIIVRWAPGHPPVAGGFGCHVLHAQDIQKPHHRIITHPRILLHRILQGSGQGDAPTRPSTHTPRDTICAHKPGRCARQRQAKRAGPIDGGKKSSEKTQQRARHDHFVRTNRAMRAASRDTTSPHL
jgi:hypothetical protein